MGNIFSICKCKNQSETEQQIKSNNSEYRTLLVEDKIYILFKNKELTECFEI